MASHQNVCSGSPSNSGSVCVSVLTSVLVSFSRTAVSRPSDVDQSPRSEENQLTLVGGPHSPLTSLIQADFSNNWARLSQASNSLRDEAACQSSEFNTLLQRRSTIKLQQLKTSVAASVCAQETPGGPGQAEHGPKERGPIQTRSASVCV